MSIPHTVRHAAKSAYQLALMVGRYESTQCKLSCDVRCVAGYVIVLDEDGQRWNVPIAKAWASL